jgi:hypothetical protein
MAVESPLADLFLQIQERIKTTVPAVKWIDLDFGQMDINTNEYKPPVIFPCSLIDLTGLTFEDLSGGNQTAMGKVIIRLSVAPFSQSNQVTSLPQRERAIEFLEIEYQIAKSLHNWKPTGFNRLLRRSQDKLDREDTLRERIIGFDFSYTDTSASKLFTKVPRPQPVIGTDILP